jgi:uncharacterized membrane protein
MDTLQTSLLSLGVVNTLLLLAIISINISSYIKFKAQYTMFIIVFAGLFLAQYAMSAYHFFSTMEVYTFGMEWHLLILTGMQTIGFAYFLWMQRQ